MASNDLLNKLVPAPVATAVKVDTLQFGLAFVVAQLLMQRSLLDKQWALSSLIALLGFAAYQLLVARLVDSSKYTEGQVKLALDDVLKFGTMLVVARYLSGDSMTDEQWMQEVAFILVGFLSFDLVTERLVTNSMVNVKSMNPKLGTAVYDGVKFGTMYLVSRWLAGGEFSYEWALSSGGFTAGLMLYDVLAN